MRPKIRGSPKSAASSPPTVALLTHWGIASALAFFRGIVVRGGGSFATLLLGTTVEGGGEERTPSVKRGLLAGHRLHRWRGTDDVAGNCFCDTLADANEAHSPGILPRVRIWRLSTSCTCNH